MTDRDRLIELEKQATTAYLDYLDSIDQKGLIDTEGRAKFTADYLLANGVIVPPCKVGDTVWVVSQGQGFNMRWGLYEGIVKDIHLNRHNKLTIRVENGEKFFGYYEPCFIHKTKEEAEQALATDTNVGNKKEREG